MRSSPVVRWLANAGHRVLSRPPLLVGVFLVVVVGGTLGVAALAGADDGVLRRLVRTLGDYLAVLILVPVGAGLGISLWWTARRGRALRRLARERDWRHTERSQTTPAPYPVDAHTTFTTDLVEGSLSGYRVRLYEFHWITGHGRHRRQREVGVGVVTLPAALPRLEVVPEGVAGTVASVLAGDVDIENAEFNRRYRVLLDTEGRDHADRVAARKYAVDVLNPRAVEALLATPAFAWRIDGRRLVGTWPVTGNTGVLVARLGALVGVARHLPSFHVQDDR